MTDETKYYLCTFIVAGDEVGKYTVEIINVDPVDYLWSHADHILINHIEMTERQYTRYVDIYG